MPDQLPPAPLGRSLVGGDAERWHDVDAQRKVLAQNLGAADLVDALGRLHQHRVHILDLVSPTPHRKLFGRAVTISFFPTCTALLDQDEFTFGQLFHDALAGSKAQAEHTVLVMASNGYDTTSMAGGTKLSRLTRDGLAGVLTDGRLRDFDELVNEPFASWCSGEALQWGGGTVTPYLANVPVVVSGVGIHPGQYIFCDASGAVVIPEADVDAVLEVAHQIQTDDRNFRAQISTENVGTAAEVNEV